MTLPRPSLLFFCGIDGSGKTTHTKLLVIYLKRKNINANFEWMRWFAFFSYPLLALCRLLKLTKRLPGYPIPIREYWRYRSIAFIWLHLFLLDYLMYVILKILFSRRIIIADRFAIDALIDIMYDTHLNPFKYVFGKFFILFIYKLLKKGVIRGVVMTVDANTVFKHRGDIPSRSYVTFRIPTHLHLARFLGLPVIDGRDDIESNFRRIVRVLGF